MYWPSKMAHYMLEQPLWFLSSTSEVLMFSNNKYIAKMMVNHLLVASGMCVCEQAI